MDKIGTMSQQQPLQSGFNFHSTAADVLKGISLQGKTAIITGGHSGLGLEATRAIAGAGAEVIIGARDVDAAKAAMTGILPAGNPLSTDGAARAAVAGASQLSNLTILALDLADWKSIKEFAHAIVSSGKHIDILINSAGIMACPERHIGEGKWEAQFAVNHLGHFLLAQELWPALKGGSRVVAVSSAGHRLSDIRWDDINFHKGYDKWQAYGQSKTANVLFAVELDKRGRSEGIRSFAIHPGKIFTPLQRFLTKEEMVAAGWIDKDGNPAVSDFKTPQQGAATQVWAATAPVLEGLGGLYCEDCDIAPMMDASGFGVRDYAIDPVSAQRLWELSLEAIK